MLRTCVMKIAQNVGFTNLKKEILEDDGTITTVTAPGDMVTCNLNSINLGKIDEDFLEEQIALQVRMLDNVITINQTPVPESRLTCDKYRAIGLGTSGYHHYLVKHGLRWESKEHIAAADALFEKIAYYAIKASMELSKEKGAYPAFKGSEWDTGKYFTRRGYTSEKMAASCCRRPQVRYAQWVSPCCGANRFNEQHCQYNGWHRSYFQENSS